MATDTATKQAEAAAKPAPSKRQPRTARLMHVGRSRVLALTCGKLTTFYRLVTLDAGFGEAAFRLEKPVNNGGEVYDVLIDGDRSTCECRGFIRHKHCKHLESIESLIAAGKLPVCRKAPVAAAEADSSPTRAVVTTTTAELAPLETL